MMFGRIEECMISLDKVTQQLGVERRRIYDIINILESLGVVYRKGKNNYQWKGLKSIHHTILKLQKCNKIKVEEDVQKLSQDEAINDNDDSSDDDGSEAFLNKKEKSLGLLSNGFIKLFFTWKETISLEQAARRLSSNNAEDNKIKTKIRRLYDIANVFSALGLIKKTCLESKKPAFMWIGLEGLDNFISRLKGSIDEKEIFPMTERKGDNDMLLETPPSSQQNSEIKEKVIRPMSIQSNNSAFKSRETITTSPPAEANKAFESLFITMFMDFCKQQFVKHLSSGEKSNHSPEPTAPNTAEKSKLQRHASSPVSSVALSERSMYTTPTVRKTVSIIQRLDKQADNTPDKSRKWMSERTALSDKTNRMENSKRIAPYSIAEFETKNFKKLHINDENSNSNSNSMNENFCMRTIDLKSNDSFKKEMSKF
jgi:hypothetical protein